MRVWSLDDGQLVAVLDDLPLLTPSLEFTTEGRRLIGANVDGRIYMWDTTTWKRVRQFKESQPEAAWSTALSPDGRLLATGGMDVSTQLNPSHVVLWNLESGEPIRTIRFAHQAIGVRFSPDGNWLAVADFEENVYLFETSKLTSAP